MCGICGLLQLDGVVGRGEKQDPTSPQLAAQAMTIRQMNVVQKHRGPDDEGYLYEEGVSLGFCRLAIIDLTSAGHQPMTNEDESIWLIFNGEIYNFHELVPVLEQHGHCFRSRSDSEVIIHAYEQWGIDCLQRFNGMFAFAIWDKQKQRILLARDRLGVKPLYYWSDGKQFAFSSELKSLLRVPQIPRHLNLQALQSFLVYEYIPAPESIFVGIQKMPAGHFLDIPLDGSAHGLSTADWQSQQYWDVHFQRPTTENRSLDDYVDELRALLQAAVARRLISDVPLGVFLSGGLDSSSVVAMMTRVSNARPKTFSIGFEEKTFNELDYAEAVARHFDTEHHVEILKPDANQLMQTIADLLDEPFADASVLPSYLVSSMARQQVTVALGGDGGDELFAGYDRYSAHKISSLTIDRLPSHIRQQLHNLASYLPPTVKKKGMLNIIRRFLNGATLSPEMQHLRWQIFCQDEDFTRLLTPSTHAQMTKGDPYQSIQSLFATSQSPHPLDQQQYADIKHYLPDDILFKVDSTSMAVSLEVRSPFLDYTLVEFAACLPASLRLRGFSGKYLLKLAMRDMLPWQILHRPKIGFNIPYKNWLRTQLRELLVDMLSPTRLQQQGIFSPQYVQSLIHAHIKGSQDHAHTLWQLLMFQLWAERYLQTLPMPEHLSPIHTHAIQTH
jgi:asparagine synthase (glutamine-hydrolysing)